MPSKECLPSPGNMSHLIGKFEFITEQTKVDLDALAARFVDPALWNRAAQDEGDDSLG